MALYGGSIFQARGGTFNTSTVAADLKAGPYNATSVFEIGVFCGSGIQSSVALARATAELLQLYPSYLAAYENGDTYSSTALAQAWSVTPVFPTSHLRRTFLTGAQGVGIIWSFPRGLKLSPSNSVVLALPSSGQNQIGQYHMSAEVDE